MIILYAFFGLIAVLMVVVFLCTDTFQDAVHCTFISSKLRPDGKPVRIDRKLVGSKGSTRWKSTVYFDDSFQFVSKRTDIQNRVFYYKISLSDQSNQKILKDAMAAHQRAVSKVQRRRNK